MMPYSEGMGPGEVKMVNTRNQEEEINRMVREGLLTPEQALDFDYSEEMEIPKALITESPKISESLRVQIISKFPPESFEPENIAGNQVHGTTIRAIRPLWLGEGRIRTNCAGPRNLKGMDKVAPGPKGFFSISGDFTRLGEDGFNHISDYTGLRDPGFEALPDMQIFLVSGKFYESQYNKSVRRDREEEIIRYETPYIQAVVLSSTEVLSDSRLLEQAQSALLMLRGEGNPDPISIIEHLPEDLIGRMYKEIDSIAKSFNLPRESGQLEAVAQEFSEFLRSLQEEMEGLLENENIDKFQKHSVESLLREIPASIRGIENYRQMNNLALIAGLGYYNRFLFAKFRKSLVTKDFLESALDAEITNITRRRKQNRGEESFRAGNRETLYLTLKQEANYIAHCMVQGVDKSKIVPIYDWDGNLLWPTDEDVIHQEDEPESLPEQN